MHGFPHSICDAGGRRRAGAGLHRSRGEWLQPSCCSAASRAACTGLVCKPSCCSPRGGRVGWLAGLPPLVHHRCRRRRCPTLGSLPQSPRATHLRTIIPPHVRRPQQIHTTVARATPVQRDRISSDGSWWSSPAPTAGARPAAQQQAPQQPYVIGSPVSALHTAPQVPLVPDSAIDRLADLIQVGRAGAAIADSWLVGGCARAACLPAPPVVRIVAAQPPTSGFQADAVPTTSVVARASPHAPLGHLLACCRARAARWC